MHVTLTSTFSLGYCLFVGVLATSCTGTNSTYDFIVVGAGPAGLVMGNRLTEDPRIRVLNIEAGPFDHREAGILIPGAWDPSPYFWPDIVTEPLTALNNRTEPIAIAKLVGGGTSLNAMNWLRGAKSDYDGLAATFSNPGWAWDDVLPFFIKSENFSEPDAAFASQVNITWDNAVRGHSGPLQYSYPNTFYPSQENWWSAAQSLGHEPIQDPNNGGGPGLSWVPSVLNTTEYTRCDARAAYYEPYIAMRPNWHVVPNTLVSRVTFEGTRATGVELQNNGSAACTYTASKEVILAAGAIHTPQVLQLSGIGPRALLQSLNIRVISDLPGVGTNLQDHATLPIAYNFTNNRTPNSMTFTDDAAYNAMELSDYNAHEPSDYTFVRGLSNNWLTVSLSSTPNHTAIIEAALAYNASNSLPTGTDPTVLAGYEAQREMLLSQMANPGVTSGNLFWFTGDAAELANVKPLSRGRVYISSTNPNDPPILDYGTVTDPADLQIFVSYFRTQRNLFAAPDMAALGPIELAPFGSSVQTDEQIIEAARTVIGPTSGHVCCTAPMMPKALGGVVDSRRKVYGVSGLRIADISAWPLEVAAGPTGTVYGLAERLADFVKQEWSIAEYRQM